MFNGHSEPCVGQLEMYGSTVALFNDRTQVYYIFIIVYERVYNHCRPTTSSSSHPLHPDQLHPQNKIQQTQQPNRPTRSVPHHPIHNPENRRGTRLLLPQRPPRFHIRQHNPELFLQYQVYQHIWDYT